MLRSATRAVEQVDAAVRHDAVDVVQSFGRFVLAVIAEEEDLQSPLCVQTRGDQEAGKQGDEALHADAQC